MEPGDACSSRATRSGGGWRWLLAWLLAIAIAAVPEEPGQKSRIKDVATIEGIRDNQLVGYGLVVGLRGTGDSSQTVFPAQTLVSALQRMGITVPQTGSNSASNMQVKNMAAVFVVATLPPFSRPGYKVDITVSSAGDARSIEGGILLMTPLYGPDGQIYAQAQGALVLGGYMATAGGNTKQMNHPTTARIPGGALVERPVPFDLKQMRTVSVVLNDADFHTAEQMAAAIDETLGSARAHAVDSRRVEIAVHAGRGHGGAARQGGGGGDRGVPEGAGGGERAHGNGGDRGHGAAAAGVDFAWRVERERDLRGSRYRSPMRCLRGRRRWCSRPRCRRRTSR